MAKRGRPKKDASKTKSITVRVSDEQHETIMQYASDNVMTITDIVQEALKAYFKDYA